ncbi:DMT family transporter [Pelagibius marinus]|uniref:DMT family transporter n=1 Tax=Pelagibius marinus TaxID=2762760 RepID=UPI001D057D39|nr:SMR family transporter [Pelagibius marinus]
MTLSLSYLLLILAILSEVIATSALKASDGMTRLWPASVVVVGYALAFLLLAQTLKTLPVGLAYAIWAGVGVVGVALVGIFYFGETMTLAKAGGIALIIVGVALVQTNSA